MSERHPKNPDGTPWYFGRGGHKKTSGRAKTPEERAVKLAKLEAERAAAKAAGYLTPKQQERMARIGRASRSEGRAERKAERAERQRRLEAESAARIAAKGGQGQRVILNARANLMVEQAAADGREMTFEEAKKIVVRDSRERWKDYLRSIGAIPGEAKNPNPNR